MSEKNFIPEDFEEGILNQDMSLGDWVRAVKCFNACADIPKPEGLGRTRSTLVNLEKNFKGDLSKLSREQLVFKLEVGLNEIRNALRAIGIEVE